MSVAPESFAPNTDSLAKPEVLLRVPVGLSSPLWGLFAGAAVSGAAWWWMTRWARPENLEAMFGAAAKAEAADVPALSAPESEAVLEALVEAAPEPVGGEATPISPVLEAITTEFVEAPAEVVEAVAMLETPPETTLDAAVEPAPKPKKATPPKLA